VTFPVNSSRANAIGDTMAAPSNSASAKRSRKKTTRSFVAKGRLYRRPFATACDARAELAAAAMRMRNSPSTSPRPAGCRACRDSSRGPRSAISAIAVLSTWKPILSPARHTRPRQG